ncbi:Acg family FMN-binding oxidoreductase [Rhodococcus chondri]|uniref:NAD(P)H nitroreductase n=1 Tax=Rhodococcus chondri TaxID=3065941 RepID=A0ABU7JN50_9NOCA|nr:hypothetical protein [Rhodococcus sp. CC-R104]MEE2031474.1 hypothetical protein [Rhodococcus sp. CC-R104]
MSTPIMGTPRNPDIESVRVAVTLACRAPSVHNSQPWRWHYTNGRLELSGDRSRVLPMMDPSGRQLVISCGAALDHLRVAFTALKWSTRIDRLPEGLHSETLATIGFGRDARPASHDFDLLSSIRRRYSDRRPFGPAAEIERVVAAAVAPPHVQVTTVPQDGRAVLAAATELSAASRRYDTAYQDELHWWTGHSTTTSGIPREALIPADLRRRVDVGRLFPAGSKGAADTPMPDADRSTVLVISTDTDERPDWLAAGETLSALLLAATVEGLATCPLTHVTELKSSRNMIAHLLPEEGYPQALIRIGKVESEGRPQATPRLPTDAVLSVDPRTPGKSRLP